MSRRTRTMLSIAGLLLGVLGGLIAWRVQRAPRRVPEGSSPIATPHVPWNAGHEALVTPTVGTETATRLSLGDGSALSVDRGAPASQAPDVPVVSKLRTLLVRVQWPGNLDFDPEGLDVRVANLTGAVYEPRRTARADFLASEIEPGTYIALAKAANSATVTARVEVPAEGPPAEVTITLAPARLLRVRWRSNGGQPVLSIRERPELERWESSQLRLEVFATVSKPDPNEPPAIAIDSLLSVSNVNVGGGSTNPVGPWLVVLPRAYPLGREVTPDTFGFLRLQSGETPWISAWMCGALVAQARVEAVQDDVLLISSDDALGLELGSVFVTVLDDVTGAPLAGAEFLCGGSFIGEERVPTDALGQVESPWLAPGRKIARLAGKGYLNRSLDFVVKSGVRTDLGIVRLRRMDDGLCAKFATFDEFHAPVAGVEFELLACNSHGADVVEAQMVRAESRTDEERGPRGPPSALVSFCNLRPSHYRLQIRSASVYADPRLVAPEELDLPSRARPVEIVVRRAFPVGFVVDPPRSGCQIRLRSTDGLLFRTLDVNEFGVGSTTLAFGSYRLDQLLHGRVVRTHPFTVDRESAVVEIPP